MPNIRHKRAKKWRIILAGPAPVVKKALKAIDERKNSRKRNRGLASIRSLGDDAHAVEWHGDPPSYNAVYSWFALALEKVDVDWRLDADEDDKQELPGTAGQSGGATGSASMTAPALDRRSEEQAAAVAEPAAVVAAALPHLPTGTTDTGRCAWLAVKLAIQEATPVSVARPQFYSNFEQDNTVLGEGSMSVVRSGRRLEDGLTVAIKVYKENTPAARAAAREEVLFLEACKHPHIVELLDVYVSDHIRLVFRHGGQPLLPHQSWIRWSKKDKQRIARQILGGLGHMHGMDVIHCDMKPANVLLLCAAGKVEHVVVSDLGSCTVDRVGFHSRLPAASIGCDLVTVQYRAPELLLGCTQYTRKIDVWSLGCILAHLSTNHALWYSNSATRVLKGIVRVLGPPSREDRAILSRLPSWRPDLVAVKQAGPQAWQPAVCEGGGFHAGGLVHSMLQWLPGRWSNVTVATRVKAIAWESPSPPPPPTCT